MPGQADANHLTAAAALVTAGGRGAAGPLGAPAASPVAGSGRLTGCVELLRQPWHWRQAQVLAEGRRGRLDSLDTRSLTVEGRGRGAGTTQFACWEGQLQNPLFH